MFKRHGGWAYRLDAGFHPETGTLLIACRTSDTPTPAWMEPTVYRIPTAAQLITMLATAGLERVDHHTVETPRHELHLFAAHRGDGPPPPTS